MKTHEILLVILFVVASPMAAADDNAVTDNAGPDKAGPDKAGPDKAGTDKAGTDKAGPDKAGPDKAGTDKAGTDKGSTDKGSTDKGSTDKGAHKDTVTASAEKSGTDNGGIVKPGQSLRELRARRVTPPPSGDGAVGPGEWSSDPIRLVGLAVFTLACLAALVLVWRKRRFRTGAGGGAARLEILDRLAISTRQWVFILRVDEKRIVVGVSGDSMTSLAVLEGDDPAGASMRRGVGSPPAGQLRGESSSTSRLGSTTRDEERFWFRAGDAAPRREDPAGGGDDASWESHLAPYRREVNRLRAMLQNWRDTTERGESAAPDRGEGKGE